MDNWRILVIGVILFLSTVLFVSAECYSSVQSIPATCEGATITSDTWDGGRHITCGTTSIAAWDKADNTFEMYKQSGGSNIRICIGETCIKDSGYAKSTSFPICTDSPVCSYNGANYTSGQTFPAGDGCNTCTCTNSGTVVCTQQACGTNETETCYAKVNDLPVSCTGGTITTDQKAACRTVVCTNGGSSLQAQACDKPGSYQPTFYEVYNQGKTGSLVTKICFGNACVDGSGYARGDLPYCIASNQTNTTPITCSYNGQIYEVNQSFPDSDGCNTCTCTGTGTVVCTQQSCQGNQTNQTTCYTSLNTLPANCTGTITSDVKGAGRTISCTGSNGNVQVQAWEKTDSQGRFFEINRQSGSGTAPTVCIGKDCLKPGWGYERGDYFPVCMNSTAPPGNTTPSNSTNTTNTTDPGASSTLTLVSGTVNGQSITSSQRVVLVAPGARITGPVQLAYNNSWPTTISVPLGATPNWGSWANTYKSYGDATGSGKTVDLNFTAPTFAGDYVIAFAYRAETDAAHVISATNWARGAPVWYDGNDIGQWSAAMVNTANSQGRVQANVLFSEGMRQQYVPATSIIVRVTTNPINTTNTTGNATLQLLAEYSAEHNQVFKCNVTGFLPTRYRWYVNDALVFEKNEGEYYTRTHETFPNYYHKFPGNGTYNVVCAADNGNQSASASRQVTISTRATPAEIANTEAIVVRPKITYIDDYRAKLEAEVFGATAPAAWFQINALYSNGMNYAQIGLWPQEDGSHFETIATFPSPYTYSVRFQGATNIEYERKAWHNAGSQIYRGCYDGPRGGTPICNAATQVLNVTIPSDPDVQSGIEVNYIGGDTFEAICHIPTYPGAYVSFSYPHQEPSFEGQPIRFNTTDSSGELWCSHTNGATDNAGHGSVSMRKSVDFTQLRQGINASASVTIAPWYPQGRNYIFECNAQGFNATRYDYDFGDGSGWQDVTFDDTYHTYANAGTYDVSCTAKNGQLSRSGTLVVNVS